jgi:hypothetical protein
VLDTDNSEHSQVVPTAAVGELPLNGRNYADLALLSTNAVKSPIAVSFSASGTPREGSFNVNGMRSTYNNFLLDGVDNNSYGTSNQGYSSQLVQPSPDAISEFKVITGTFSAEYGRVGGAIVNAAMKSGTNQFHGSAWEFLRNTDLNATGFLFSPSVFVKPTLQRNQFGATIGGPIVRNKLFFFGDYEGYRQLQRYLNFDSIPDATDREGIFPVAVTNPQTGVTYPANTQIPIQQLNPFAYYALSNLPPTNNAGCTPSGTTRFRLPAGPMTTRRCCSSATTATSTTPKSTARSTIACRHSSASASARTCSITRPISPVPPAATATATSTPSIRTLPPAIRGPSRRTPSWKRT